MSKTIAIHSFGRGVGKSILTTNIAALLANAGQRVGVVDVDLYAPSIHIPFRLEESQITHVLNDYLAKHCPFEDVVYDVSACLPASSNGKIYLVPTSSRMMEINRIVMEGYELASLHQGLDWLIQSHHLDVLLLDVSAGLNEDTLLPIAISDVLVVILRPDPQNYQGTAAIVEIANRLDVGCILLVPNMVPTSVNFDEVKAKVEETYHCEVGSVLPYSEDIMALANSEIFVLRYPNHPITQSLKHLAEEITSL
jgi:MinD-like ATPase involved in chromosome partitioning or flagellar assembly